MNKKKLLTLAVAVALVGAVGVGSTLAYFTDKDDAQNVITMGHVDIDLDEPGFDNDDDEHDNTIGGVVPGDVITKDPTITVAEDSEDAYIRAKVVMGSTLTDTQKVALLANINIDTTKWYYNSTDGYYYYKDIVTAGNKVVLFDTVTIPETWGNETADLTFTIDVSAEAIQADNFTPTKNAQDMITAWTYEDGTAITAESYTE